MTFEVTGSEQRFSGRVVRLRSDRVVMPGGTIATRDIVEHPGAVGVLALDAEDRVVLLHQYRHAVGTRLWEIPAGLLDVAGEPAARTAARELAEEAGLAAQRWDVLLDALTSPGMTDEAVRIFLARETSATTRPAAGDDEEADMTLQWVPLEEAVARVLSGDIRNAMACLALLAVSAWRARGEPPLLPADAPGPERPGR
jgi:8-oxo-dGTP pyrophosphatase MutT (NUDIX family)